VTAPWIYLAGPLFTQGEINFNQQLAEQLRAEGYRVYLPQQECAGVSAPQELYRRCMKGLASAALVLVILDGADADSGSCFEMGYAHAQGVPIVGLRTDFRGSGDHLGLNLMLTQSCTRLLLTSLAPLPDSEHIKYLPLGVNFLPLLLEVLTALPAAQATRQ